MIDDACAAESSEQTSTLDDPPLLVAPVAVPTLALPAAEVDGDDPADVLDDAVDDLDPFEQAAADMVTSTRLAAVNTVGNRMTLGNRTTVGNRMTFPPFGRSTVARATER